MALTLASDEDFSEQEEDFEIPSTEDPSISSPVAQSLVDRFGIALETAQLMIEQDLMGDEAIKFITEDELAELGWSLAARIRRRRWLAGALPAAATTVPAPGPSRPTPSPKGLPTYDSESGKWSARVFLEEFDLVCDVNDYPPAKRPLLLVSRLKGLARTWGKMNIKAADPWSVVTQRFVTHFSRADEDHHLRDQLFALRQKTGESVRAFSTRMQEIVRRLGDDINNENILFIFRRGLLPALQSSYVTAISIHKPIGFEDAVLQAIKLEPFKAERHSEPTANREPARPPPSATTTPKAQANNPASASTMPKKKIEGASQTTCFNCGLKGHISSQCRKPKKREVIEIDVLDVDRQVNQLTESQSDFDEDFNKDSQYPYLEDTDHLVQPSPEILTIDSTSVSGLFNPTRIAKKKIDRIVPGTVTDGGIQIPILLNNRREYALLDTGSNVSAINGDLQFELSCPVVHMDGTIQSATGPTLRIGVVNLRLEIRGVSIQHDFEVLPSLSPRVLIGRDLMTRLGISITGLPVQWPDEPQRSGLMDHDDTKLVRDTQQGWVPLDPNSREMILEAIRPEIETNSATQWFCTHPSAVIPIDTGDHQPVYHRPYEVPHALKPLVTEKIQDLLRRGIIRANSKACRWNMPLLVAPKKDLLGRKTGIRVCLDTRRLNPLIPEDSFKVPLIRDIFAKTAGFTCASLIDLKEGYHQFLLLLKDQEKTTFQWNGQSFCYVGGPFGLRNIPGLFQRVMTEILEECSAFCVVYIDDILIWSRSADEHITHLKAVLSKLNQVNLTISADKSHIGFKQVVLLGHVYDGSSIYPEQSKITTFTSLTTPTTGKQVESLLGLANYLRDFIPLYSSICAPLEKLRKVRSLGKQWTQECQHAFDTLKAVLASAPILSTPDFTQPFLVGTDASKGGVGAVLYQEIAGTRRYISFASAALSQGQRNYGATRREMLAIIFALKKFRPFLYGNKFTLFTDHRALTYLLSQSQANSMLAFWAETILEYDMIIVHRPGVTMILEDALSRLYPNSVTSVNPNPKFPDILAVQLQQYPQSALKEFIAQRLDKELVSEPELRTELIQQAHDLGHFGTQSVFHTLFTKGFYWPTMLKDITSFISKCNACRRFSFSREGYHPLQPILSEQPMMKVSIDTLGPLPTTVEGHNYVLVVVDLFTRFIFLEPMIAKSASDVSQALMKIFSQFGFPRELLSDNGSEFKNQVVKGLATLVGFTQKFSLPYNPRVNGAAENAVKLTKAILFKLAVGDFSEWNRLLPFISFALNSRLHSRHNSSAFALMFGRDSKTNIGNIKESIEDDGSRWKDRIQQLVDEVHPAILETSKHTALKMKKYHDKYRNLTDPLRPGTKVMVRRTDRASKLTPAFSGPFTVIKRSGNSYVLTDPTGELYPTKIPIHRLKKLEDDESIDDPGFEVEEIRDHRGDGADREYLVKWLGFSEEVNSWVKSKDFFETDIITAYHKNLIPKES